MAIARISAWLRDPGRQYDYGKLLYDQYGDKTLLKALFSAGSSSYHFDRLQEALEELNGRLTEIPEIAPEIPSPRDIPVPARRGSVSDADWEKLPDAVKDLYTLNSQLHAHSQLLFSRMRISGDDAARGQLALEILQDRGQLNENWKLIKDFHAGGQLLEAAKPNQEKQVEEMSVVELTALIRNIPSYLSKDRKRLEKLTDGSKRNKVLLRIRERELQLELARKRLEEI